MQSAARRRCPRRLVKKRRVVRWRPSMTGRANTGHASSAFRCADDVDRLSQPAFDVVLVEQEKAALVGDPALGRLPRKFAMPSRDLGIARRAQRGCLMQARRPIMAQRSILDTVAPAAFEE